LIPPTRPGLAAAHPFRDVQPFSSATVESGANYVPTEGRIVQQGTLEELRRAPATPAGDRV
jgi:hypothetical protein